MKKLKHLMRFDDIVNEAKFNKIASFKDNLKQLSDLEMQVYQELISYKDMSPHDALMYAGSDAYYLDNGDDVTKIVAEIRSAFEEDTKPSDELIKVKDAIVSNRLKILRAGKKRYGKYTLIIQEYVWARNYMDGYGISVYDENGKHIGNIEYIAPEYIPNIVRN